MKIVRCLVLSVLSLFLILTFAPYAVVMADPHLEISPDLFIGNQNRGAGFSFNVIVRNVGTGDARNPTVTVFTGDPVNVRIVGSASRTWADNIIPADGKPYSLGEFAFQISTNAPDGNYIIRIEVSYTTGVLLTHTSVDSTNLQLVVEPTAAEKSTAALSSALPFAAIGVVILAIVAIVIAKAARKRT